MNNILEQERLIEQSLKSLPYDPSLIHLDGAFLSASKHGAKLLPYFGDDLEKAALAMAKKIINSEVIFTLPLQNSLTGLSGHPIFFVGRADKPVKPLLTIKAFSSTTPTFAKAVWAQQNLLRIKALVPPLLHIGMATHAGQKYFLIASPFLEGIIVNDLIFSLAALPDNEARRAAQENLVNIIQKIAALLASLHTSGDDHYAPSCRVTTEIHHQALKKTVKLLERKPELGIDGRLVNNAAIALMDNMAKHQYRHGFLHGDAHPGNYLYDQKNNSVYALDLDEGARSINANRRPTGSPYTDYIKFVLSMKVRELFFVTKEETAIFRKAFDDSYTINGGTLPSLALTEFYTLMEVLDYCAWYESHEALLTKESSGIMHSILQTGLSWLGNILKT